MSKPGQGGAALRVCEPSPSRADNGRDALADIYREHHKFVWRTLRRFGVPSEHVGDALQDVFVVVARRLPEFEGRASIRTWIFQVSMRVAQAKRRDAARDYRRQQALHQRVVLPDTPSHGRAVESRELLGQLLDGLDDEKRAVFILSELEGMTLQEIAQMLGLRRGTVASRLRLARERLARAVTRHDARETRVRRGTGP